MNSRANRSTYASWWWTIDRVALVPMLLLIAIGLMLAFAASPAATGGPLTAGDFRYTSKQILFACIAAGILAGASVLSLQQLKIAAALTFALALIGSALVLVAGTEVLGAKRSIEFGLFSLQPSEFLKPGFAVLGAAICGFSFMPMFLAVGLVAEGFFLFFLVLCISAGNILLDFALEDERFFEMATRNRALFVFVDDEESLPQPS